MMNQVVIEGTHTPSDRLATGVRRRVAVNDEIRQLVRIGAVVVVEGSLDGPEPAAASTASTASVEPEPSSAPEVEEPTGTGDLVPDEPPGRNASREDWAEWIAANGFGVTDGLSRDELIELWDAHDGER